MNNDNILNEINEELKTLNASDREYYNQLVDYDKEIIQAIKEVTSQPLAMCLQDFNRGGYEYYKGFTPLDLAHEYVDNGCFGEIPEDIVRYIDYNAIAYDLSLDFYQTSTGLIFLY